MRKVDRGLAIPAVLDGPNSVGAKETVRAIAYHLALAAGKRSGARPKFTVYSRPQIRESLTALFAGKCAYCESTYAATQPVDVEHYRPKAAVAEAKNHLGYYWLAADWENLLPSCIDCNRVREQTAEKKSGMSGKGTRFPLLQESTRMRGPQDPKREKPLLLNPCDDNPEAFLQFNESGLVRPKARSGPDRKRAKASIAIYGLNRIGLVSSRREILFLLKAKMITITKLATIMERVAPNHPDLIIEIEDLLAHELKVLGKYAEPGQPYSLMCEQLIRDFRATFTP
jgi:uncharacterized protein (TIGR02646 family)